LYWPLSRDAPPGPAAWSTDERGAPVVEVTKPPETTTPSVPVPEPVQEALRRAQCDDDVRIAASSDLAADGNYGERWLAVTDSRVMVVSKDGNGGMEVDIDLPLKEITALEIENLVGAAALCAVVEGRRVDLVRFTSGLSKRFARTRTQLDALREGKPVPEIPEEQHVCPTCGLVLGEETRVCPRCLKKSAVLMRLLGYARPYRARLVLLGLLMLAATAAQLVPPYLTRFLIDDVLTSPHRHWEWLGPLVAGLAGSGLLGMALTIWRGRLSAWMGGRVSFDMRAELYDRLQWLSLKYYDRHPTGAVISRLTQDSSGVQDVLAFGLPFTITNLLTLLGVTAVLLSMNWELTLLALLPGPIVSTLTRMLWRRMRDAFHRYWYRWSRFYGLVNDALGRVRVTKAFSQQRAEIGRYGTRNAELMGAIVGADQLWATVFPAVGFLFSIGGMLIWYFGGWKVLRQEVSLGELVAFMGYLGMVYGPMNMLSQLIQWISRAITAAERIFEVLDAEADSERGRGEIVPETILGDIEFKDVTFGYQPHQPVLKEVSFRIEHGTMLGLVGRSGAGKSTVINLICRFYEADQGEITVDGIPIKDLSLWAYRGRLGAVLQEPFLFSGTVAENIAYGKPEATLEEIMAAAKVANAHDFILGKPDGYDTQIGEHGGNLSGGEKQRVCIARAILHDPAILILDEATANVDLETEEQIQEAITRLIEGRTTIAIAHRLSTLRNAHNLLVVEDGKVAEYGTHEELEEKKGKYYDLLQMHRKTSAVEAWKE
jgi:ATP-binding cassette subfamily B protein